ncbi:MAG: O-antigen ligase family protein [Candidatus Gracilibacteria bacterium]|nr:O-antigen ligase family protein [Candidatus Gracilibacteria bacterium]
MKLKYNLFTYGTLLFVLLMPFYVLIKVFFEHKLGIGFFGVLIKEFMIFLLGLCVVYEYIKQRQFPKIDFLDIFIFLYLIYGIGITLVQGLSLEHIIYGGRYDYMFLGVFLIYKHGAKFLQISTQKVIQFFIYSASISLFFGILIKFLLGETSLMYFGFSDYAGHWTFQGSIPSFHGLENSGIRRFQGILEGPNAMSYFLIVYGALILHLQKIKFQFHNVIFVFFILWLVLLTYSRSAMLGIGIAGASLFLFHIRYIYRSVKKYILPLLLTLSIVIGSLSFLFQEKIYNVVVRPGSTTGHFERMDVGIQRFIEQPMGSGLATSGPAYRNVYPEKTTREDELYYIPESWFIQQLTEGGFIYFSLFLLIFLSILWKLAKKSPIMMGALIAVLVMNIFLHIFESTHMSSAFFLFIALIIYQKKN